MSADQADAHRPKIKIENRNVYFSPLCTTSSNLFKSRECQNCCPLVSSPSLLQYIIQQRNIFRTNNELHEERNIHRARTQKPRQPGRPSGWRPACGNIPRQGIHFTISTITLPPHFRLQYSHPRGGEWADPGDSAIPGQPVAEVKQASSTPPHSKNKFNILGPNRTRIRY